MAELSFFLKFEILVLVSILRVCVWNEKYFVLFCLMNAQIPWH